MALVPVALVALLVTSGVPATAQEEQPGAEQPGVFGEVIDVRVVNLEVVVERRGDRITGLGPDDFELTVDGREVPIEYFTEVIGGTAVVPQEGGTTVPALAPGETVGTSYLVFIDEFFSRPNDRDRIVRRLSEQTDLMNPEDRMAVVAYDGKRVEMLSSWNQNPEELQRVFRKAQERPAFGLQREAERRGFSATLAGSQAIDDPLNPLPINGLSVEEQQLVDLLTGQVEKVTLAATSALRSFANPPGRKVMLLLSGGWPRNPSQWVVNDPDRYISVTGFFDSDDLYDPLIDTANRLSYTLYPVDVPGLNAAGIDASDVTSDDSALRATRVLDREQEEEFALTTLAQNTGGKALLDSAALDVLDRVAQDTRSYYWIGFTPTWQGDDSAHKVRIKTRAKGMKVRARKSYSDLSRQTEVSMMVESSLLFGNVPTAAPLGVQLGQTKKSGWGKVLVPIRIAIPVGELTFLNDGEKWLAQTELRVAVLDEFGNTADIPVIPLGLQTDEEPEASDFTLYETQVKIRKKKHDMVVSIYDKPSGKILSTRLEVDPKSLN